MWAYIQPRGLGESMGTYIVGICTHSSSCVPYHAQARHERVCAKNQQQSKKRPVFDTAKKRMAGTDLESFLASRPYLKSKKPSTAELVSSMNVDVYSGGNSGTRRTCNG